MSEGYVYCFSNPTMPGLLKIGMTLQTPEKRAKGLFSTGVAEPFVIEFAKKVINPKEKEKELHVMLKTDRHNKSREYFKTSTEKALKCFNAIDGIEWPVEEEVPIKVLPENIQIFDSGTTLDDVLHDMGMLNRKTPSMLCSSDKIIADSFQMFDDSTTLGDILRDRGWFYEYK